MASSEEASRYVLTWTTASTHFCFSAVSLSCLPRALAMASLRFWMASARRGLTPGQSGAAAGPGWAGWAGGGGGGGGCGGGGGGGGGGEEGGVFDGVGRGGARKRGPPARRRRRGA